MYKTVIIMICVSALLAAANLLLKTAVIHFKTGVQLSSALQFISDYKFWTSILFTGMAMILWLYVLSYEQISTVYPLISISYVFMTFASYYLYDEKITSNKIIGMGLICFGIYFLFKETMKL
ncbi:MAG: EamA family transporter [Deltaproteobacteria bacterium]|nr:EamA family transporter [Deltaproteobacteria bacterium]